MFTLVALDLGKPVRKRQLRSVAQLLLDQREGGGNVTLAHEQVQILHGAADSQVALQRVAPADQEVDTSPIELGQHGRVEPAGHRREAGHLYHRPPSAGHRRAHGDTGRAGALAVLSGLAGAAPVSGDSATWTSTTRNGG